MTENSCFAKNAQFPQSAEEYDMIPGEDDALLVKSEYDTRRRSQRGDELELFRELCERRDEYID